MMNRVYWPGYYIVMDNQSPVALLLVGSYGSRVGLSKLESGRWIDGKGPQKSA